VSAVNEVSPLATTANGCACLAALDRDKGAKLVPEAYACRDLPTDPNLLLGTLGEVRATSLAYDLENRAKGISAIVFAFHDWTGDLHAISVPIRLTRLADQRDVVEARRRKTVVQLDRLMRESPDRSSC
jgi:DNA-binding IclR family transcriptional regulator